MILMTGVIGGGGMVCMICMRVDPGRGVHCRLLIRLLMPARVHAAAGLAGDPGIGDAPGQVGCCGWRSGAAVILERRYMGRRRDARLRIGSVTLLRLGDARHQCQKQAIFE